MWASVGTAAASCALVAFALFVAVPAMFAKIRSHDAELCRSAVESEKQAAEAELTSVKSEKQAAEAELTSVKSERKAAKAELTRVKREAYSLYLDGFTGCEPPEDSRPDTCTPLPFDKWSTQHFVVRRPAEAATWQEPWWVNAVGGGL